jgi:hypothetical protein
MHAFVDDAAAARGMRGDASLRADGDIVNPGGSVCRWLRALPCHMRNASEPDGRSRALPRPSAPGGTANISFSRSMCAPCACSVQPGVCSTHGAQCAARLMRIAFFGGNATPFSSSRAKQGL